MSIPLVDRSDSKQVELSIGGSLLSSFQSKFIQFLIYLSNRIIFVFIQGGINLKGKLVQQWKLSIFCIL